MQCLDKGTEAEPIEIMCPACDEKGCDHCDNGYVTIIGCPEQYCREMVPVIDLIDLYNKGLPPVAGGSLDQAAWFISAQKQMRYEEASVKNAN